VGLSIDNRYVHTNNNIISGCMRAGAGCVLSGCLPAWALAGDGLMTPKEEEWGKSLFCIGKVWIGFT